MKILILFFCFLLSSFCSSLTEKLYSVYERSAHQMIALLSEVILFLARAACKLRSVSYGSKHVVDSFLNTILCVLTCTTWKLKVVLHSVYWMTAVLLEISIFCIRAGCELRLVGYGSKHSLHFLSDNTSLYRNNLKTTGHIHMCGYSAYRMTPLLLETFFEWYRVAWEIWLEGYGLRHASVVLW